jgi:hypothetical protein
MQIKDEKPNKKKSDESDDEMDYGEEWAENGNTLVIAPSIGLGGAISN